MNKLSGDRYPAASLEAIAVHSQPTDFPWLPQGSPGVNGPETGAELEQDRAGASHPHRLCLWRACFHVGLAGSYRWTRDRPCRLRSPGRLQCPTHYGGGEGGGALGSQREAQETEGRESWAVRVSLELAPASPARVSACSASPWVQCGPPGFPGGTGLGQWGRGDQPSANRVLARAASSPVLSQKVSSLATELASISPSIGQVWAPGCRMEACEKTKPEVWTPEPGWASAPVLRVASRSVT